jgi:hypothetical protein
MRTVFSIDIKVDIEAGDEERAQVMLDATKIAARELFAQMTLLAGKRPPEVAIRTNDSMHGTAEVELFPTGEELNRPKE